MCVYTTFSSFSNIVKSPPKHVTSTPKFVSASQPSRPSKKVHSSKKSSRCMSASPENAPEKKKQYKGHSAASFIKKPSNQTTKKGRKN